MSDGIEYLALQCAQCRAFVSQQRRKDKKWVCKLCAFKQSITRVYFVSDRAADVRMFIQDANMKRGERELEVQQRRLEQVDNSIEPSYYDDNAEGGGGSSKAICDEDASAASMWDEWNESASSASADVGTMRRGDDGNGFRTSLDGFRKAGTGSGAKRKRAGEEGSEAPSSAMSPKASYLQQAAGPQRHGSDLFSAYKSIARADLGVKGVSVSSSSSSSNAARAGSHTFSSFAVSTSGAVSNLQRSYANVSADARSLSLSVPVQAPVNMITSSRDPRNSVASSSNGSNAAMFRPSAGYVAAAGQTPFAHYGSSVGVRGSGPNVNIRRQPPTLTDAPSAGSSYGAPSAAPRGGAPSSTKSHDMSATAGASSIAGGLPPSQPRSMLASVAPQSRAAGGSAQPQRVFASGGPGGAHGQQAGTSAASGRHGASTGAGGGSEWDDYL